MAKAVLAFLFSLVSLVPIVQAEELDRSRIHGIIREYIKENPEIVEQALAELQRRAQASEEEAKATALRREAAALFKSADDVVMGNPDGDVSLVEFFDFNCGYCKRAAPDVKALIESNPKLRVVLKDLPVLGQGSVEAAKIGLAVKRVAGNKIAGEFHKRLMDLRGRIDGQRAVELAVTLGLDRKRIEAEAAGSEIGTIIAANLALAERLGINGTPSFVVGDKLLVGAVGEAALKEAIRERR